VGLVCARLGAARVVVTDVEAQLPLLRDNVRRNALGDRVAVQRCKWGDVDDVRAATAALGGAPDLVLGADIVYCAGGSAPDPLRSPRAALFALSATLQGLLAHSSAPTLRDRAVALLAYKRRLDPATDAFVHAELAEAWDVRAQEVPASAPGALCRGTYEIVALAARAQGAGGPAALRGGGGGAAWGPGGGARAGVRACLEPSARAFSLRFPSAPLSLRGGMQRALDNAVPNFDEDWRESSGEEERLRAAEAKRRLHVAMATGGDGEDDLRVSSTTPPIEGSDEAWAESAAEQEAHSDQEDSDGGGWVGGPDAAADPRVALARLTESGGLALKDLVPSARAGGSVAEEKVGSRAPRSFTRACFRARWRERVFGRGADRRWALTGAAGAQDEGEDAEMAGAALESSGRCDSAELREEKFWPEEDWELSDSARRDSTELRFVTTSRAPPAPRPRPPWALSAFGAAAERMPLHRVPCTGVRAARDARRGAVGCWSAPRSCGRRRASAERGRARWRRSSRTMRCCRTARRLRSSRVRTPRTMTTSTPSPSRPTSSCEPFEPLNTGARDSPQVCYYITRRMSSSSGDAGRARLARSARCPCHSSPRSAASCTATARARSRSRSLSLVRSSSACAASAATASLSLSLESSPAAATSSRSASRAPPPTGAAAARESRGTTPARASAERAGRWCAACRRAKTWRARSVR